MTAWDRLTAELDAWATAGQVAEFWWRDDDAIEPTDDLDRLIEAATEKDVPLVLAVIPDPAVPALFSHIGGIDQITVSQHGFAHINHETPPTKSAELGTARDPELVLTELTAGKLKLQHCAGRRFAPILTPPWNRVSPVVAQRRFEIGLPGLSTFGPAGGDDYLVNTHFDVIAWRKDRGFIGWEKAIRIVEEEIQRRLDGKNEPFGLLTHHLVHDADVWTFLDCFLSLAKAHKAVRWPDPRALFSLPEN